MAHYGIVHMIVSAIIHGLIYSVIWKIMRSLTIPEAIALAVIVLTLLGLASLIMSQIRRHRRY